MRKLLVAANWKMNGRLEQNRALLQSLKNNGLLELNHEVDVLIIPPACYLSQVSQELVGTQVKLGAQNICSWLQDGAFTGEMNAQMMVDLNVSHVLVGHSERRAFCAESDELVAEKTKACLVSGLVPLVCVGETLDEREQGLLQAVLSRQVLTVAKSLDEEALSKVVWAYEPVWAIGTGLTATPEQAQEVHAFIRSLLATVMGQVAADKLHILYGGSVKANNAVELFAQKDIDGGLIGGASLSASDFLGICNAAKKREQVS
ncbi:triose-phosphate isomerase [Nitrincola tapanii]|uniref:Triosephosphate isomerase n=1 Tax=Nitrincola tapanii TaxID=1708751 RepID=A0A5A9VYS3_9GAMM|nr:triose-phosphate isomerase [Nitrincola tapanii]KAA0873680.1 triose-phosphate isomerase [Nitrincola tapanii]